MFLLQFEADHPKMKEWLFEITEEAILRRQEYALMV